MTLGKDFAEVTAGIDALYRAGRRGAGFLDREGLIPVAVAEVAPRPFDDWPAVQDALADLIERIPSEVGDAQRRDWLVEMALSLRSLARMFAGERLGFAERLRDQLRVDTTVVPETVLDGYRATLRAALDEMGYRSGDLGADVGGWEDATTVPPDHVIAVLDELQDEAQVRSARLTFYLGADRLAPKGVRDQPFNAYCDYPGRQLWLNLDYRYTRADLKHLATHEAFPGHLVHLARREALVADGRMPPEGAQVVTNSASSALFEGIADNGAALLDWVETPEDHAAIALQRLRSALRCNASWMIHAEGHSARAAAEATAGPSFQDVETTEGRLRLAAHDLRKTFLYAYWCGDVAVDRFLQATRDWDRRSVVCELFDRMHTPGTLLAAAGLGRSGEVVA